MGTQDDRYSAKMATPALRAMAGYDKDEHTRLPRGRPKPSQELASKLFTFVEEAEVKVNALLDANIYKPTAKRFLNFCKVMRNVAFQDAAVIKLQYPERFDHPYYKMACFQGEDFQVSGVVFVCFVKIDFSLFYFAAFCRGDACLPSKGGRHR